MGQLFLFKDYNIEIFKLKVFYSNIILIDFSLVLIKKHLVQTNIKLFVTFTIIILPQIYNLKLSNCFSKRKNMKYLEVMNLN